MDSYSRFVRSSLQEHAPICDGVVVLAHMDYRDQLVDKIWAAVRKGVGAAKPLQIVAGHSHIRGFRPCDLLKIPFTYKPASFQLSMLAGSSTSFRLTLGSKDQV